MFIGDSYIGEGESGGINDYELISRVSNINLSYPFDSYLTSLSLSSPLTPLILRSHIYE